MRRWTIPGPAVELNFEASAMSYGLISDLRGPGLTFLDLVLFGLACCLLWFSVYVAMLVTRWNWPVANGKSSPRHARRVWDSELDSGPPVPGAKLP
jgi:hypothetical protein